MVERILVPLDGSALAEQALPHALAVARAFGSEVLLLRVLGSPTGPVNGVDWRLRRAEASLYLDNVAARLGGAGVEISRHVATGNAPEQILAAVRKRKADLLVLCRHGEGGLTEFHLSGTAAKLVESANCSILVVDPDEAGGSAAAGAASYRTVLVPVDCSKRSEWAVSLAAAIARAAGAELVLVHVASPPEVVEPASGNPRASLLSRGLWEINRDAARTYLDALAARIGAPGLAVRRRVVENGHVGPTLLRTMREEGASLVVLSAHGHAPALGASYGSVASALVADSTAPVLIFQDAPLPERPAPAAAGAPAGAVR
ncbi:MAG TPA: universal stress protein [Longimicrobium sp.]|nr:universal stress protein [Longimicrobium sp.]